MRIAVLLIASVTAVTAQAQTQAQSPVTGPPKGETSVKRDEFAFGATIAEDGKHALQRVVLPPEVYNVLTRADASDLAVFNKNSSQVPHALRRSSESRRATPDVKLSVFPLKAESQDALYAMAITVERSENGSVATVRTGEAPTSAGMLVAYLVDTSALEQPVRGLTFAWADEGASFVQAVRIESSDDLGTWSSAAHGTLAHLTQAGQRIERDRIEITPLRAKYLRISWPGSSAPPTALATVTASLAARIDEPTRIWTQVEDVTSPSPNVYRVHIEGAHPVDRLRVQLPENNTIAQATLSSAKTADGPWSTRFAGLVYRFDDRDVQNTTLPVDDVDDAFWQLEISAQGGGLGTGMPSIDIGWLPHEVVFAMRGEPPFSLAYGNANKRVASFDMQALLDIARKSGDETIGDATITRVGVELGGASRLTPEPPDTTLPLRRMILWGSLGAAVLLLGWMSVRLFKQMGS